MKNSRTQLKYLFQPSRALYHCKCFNYIPTFIAIPLFPFLLACTFVLLACTGPAPVLHSKNIHNTPISKGTKIVVLEPKITYEKLENKQSLPLDQYDSKKTAQQIVSYAEYFLRERGFNIPENRLIRSSNLLKLLTKTSDQIIQVHPNQITFSILEKFCGTEKNTAVLAQTLRVKVGAGGFWNPLNGAIGVTTHSTYIRAALFDCEKNQSVWRNSILYRDLPKPIIFGHKLKNKVVAYSEYEEDDNTTSTLNFKNTLSLLYSNINTIGG